MIRIQEGQNKQILNSDETNQRNHPDGGQWTVMTRGRIIRFAGRASQFRESYSMALSHAMTEYWFYGSIFNRK